MADALATNEAVVRAVVEKAPTTPLVSDVEKAAGLIRERKAKEGPRATLEGMRVKKPLDQQKIDRVIDQNIGTEVNPDGTKKRPSPSAVETRYEDAKKFAKLAKEFDDGGYDSLAPADQDKVRDALQTRLSKADASIKQLFDSMASNPALLKKTLEDLAHDGKFADSVRGFLEQRTKAENILSAKEVQEADEKLKEADAAWKLKEAEWKAKEKERVAIAKGLDDYKDHANDPSQRGEKMKTLRALEDELPQLNADKVAFEAEYEQYDQNIKSLEAQKAALQRNSKNVNVDAIREAQVDQERWRQNAADTAKKIAEIKQKLEKREALRQEKAWLENREREAEREHDILEREYRALEAKKFLAQAELNDKQLTREINEKEFVEGLEQIFSDAAEEYLVSGIESTQRVQQALLAEQERKSLDEAEKKVIEAISTEWTKTEEKRIGWSWRKRKIKVPNEGPVKLDFNLLLDQGPEGVIRRLLKLEFSDEIVDKKMQDASFIEKMRPQIAYELLEKFVKLGDVKPEHADKLIRADWFDSMMRHIQSKKGFPQEMLQKAQEAGFFTGDIGDVLKKRDTGHALSMLLILTGTLGTIAAQPAFEAFKEAFKEKHLG